MVIQIVFFAMLFALVITLAGCVILCMHKKGEFQFLLLRLFISGMFACSFYFGFSISPTAGTATILGGLYFASIDWMLYWLLRYAVVYTENMVTFLTISRRVILGAVWIDTAALIFDVKTQFMFHMERAFHERWQMAYWSTQFHWPHYIHLGFCYLLTVMIVGMFILKIIRSPKSYRKMYANTLICFIVIILINFFYYSLDMPLDVSVLLYGMLAYFICYFTYFSIPKGLRERTLIHVVEDINSGIFCFDINGKCKYVNKKGADLFEIKNVSEYGRIESFHINWLNQHVESKEIDHKIWNETYCIDDEIHYFKIEFQRLLDRSQNQLGYFFKIEDKTEDQKEFEMEQYLATHDSLTGLFNRDYFFQRAEELLTREPDVPRHMVCTNIRNFKLVNDLFGEELGDKVLIEQANALKLAKYNTCIQGRIAGDKFAMLIPRDKFNPAFAVRNTGRIQNLLSEYNFRLQILIGVYEITDVTEPAKIMYDKANMAISLLDENYEKLFAFYDETIMEKLIHEKEVTDEFELALSTGEFCMFLQPQVDRNGTLTGAEAVARWNHPKNGLMMPSDFIDVLEKSGQIIKMDQFIWRKAAMKLADWKKRGWNDFSISVNISSKDFFFVDLYQFFTELVESYEIDPQKLNLEITETVFMTDVERHMKIINQLQEYGFSIEIDDFGSGYSSLNLLKDIHASKLKIDMVFLQKFEYDERNQIILTSICDMAHSLQMPLIVEGIENEQQLHDMVQIGCHIFQGNYFSEPIPVAEFEQKYLA